MCRPNYIHKIIYLDDEETQIIPFCSIILIFLLFLSLFSRKERKKKKRKDREENQLTVHLLKKKILKKKTIFALLKQKGIVHKSKTNL